MNTCLARNHACLSLALQGVSKKFGEQTVLHDVSLSLVRGGITCLLGPSGCGKSTLLRVAAGLLPAEEGRVLLDARQCAMVFQEPRLLPWLTVEENLALAVSEKTAGRGAQPLLEALAQVALGDIRHRLPRELSGGMAQRVGLARALLRRPQYLLMDEPFAALDAITRASLQQMLVTLIAERQITCLFVTHDIDEALRIGNRIHVLQSGSVIFSADVGTTETCCEPAALRRQVVACLQPANPTKTKDLL